MEALFGSASKNPRERERENEEEIRLSLNKLKNIFIFKNFYFDENKYKIYLVKIKFLTCHRILKILDYHILGFIC